MLSFITGDLLKSNAEALVNTVNIVGVMGKGIALQFKESFPHNNKIYVQACKTQQLQVGQLLAVWDTNLLLGKKLIINFPTKTHWRQPSKYEYIESGLKALVSFLQVENITSVALPPLGCGNGGLDWAIVKPMITRYLGDLPIDVQVFEPNANIKSLLQKENSHKPAKLTPARVQLLYALFAYESLGEYSSLFAANKLAYFLQRMGQPLRLKFEKNNYGPYALGVEKVLFEMNGVYLRGLEQNQAKPFEPLQLNYEMWPEIKDYFDRQLTAEERSRALYLVQFMTGFTSELSLEILASVSFILHEKPGLTYEEVKCEIKNWSRRKELLFKDNFLKTAYDHLTGPPRNFLNS